jgi:serine/threonine protein kinase
MGEVWLAQASGHGGFTKSVVVKTLLPELVSDPLFVEMLAHEARICARLSHPNLIEVFDFSFHDGIYLLAMEHVVGRPLSHIIKGAQQRGIEIPVWFALRLAWEACRGLECAHEQGVIHCDLSPSNVMVTFTGVTKILDFGVAHSSAMGDRADRLKGKFSYMAPERIRSLATDRRTDVYALGVMLYLLFTGRLPFVAENDQDLLAMIINSAPRPPSAFCEIDPITEQIILRAMQREPSARYQTIDALLGELSHRLDGLLGTFGQHDVAAFLKELFETQDMADTRRIVTSAGTVRDNMSDALTWQPDEPDELRSVDVVIEPSVLEVESVRIPPVFGIISNPQARPEPRPTAAFVSRARASSLIKPDPSAPLLVMPDDAELREHTSVQSLFGGVAERASAVFGGPSGVFDRPDEILTTTEAEAEALRAPSRGGFGGYSIVRRATATNWPWASSRTKPE